MENNKDKNVKSFNEWKVEKEYDSFFDVYGDDEELPFSKDELEKKRLQRSTQFKNNLIKYSKTIKSEPLLTMDEYRNRILNRKEKGLLKISFDEINKIHNDIYGCDFEPKFKN